MTHRYLITLVVLGVLLGAGSVAAQEKPDKSEAAKEAEQPKEEEEAEEDGEFEAPPNVEKMMTPEGPETPFAALIAEGLDQHPAVMRRRAEVELEQARLRGVGLKPDPMVSLALDNIPWSDPGLSSSPMSGIRLGVTQPLWWPGELAALREQVEAQAAARVPLVDEQQVDLVIQAAELYYEIYRIDRSIEALEKLKPPVREFLRLLRARIPTGKASVSQVERVRLQLLRIDDDIFMLMHQRPKKVSKLNALLNRPAGSAVNPPSEEAEELTAHQLDDLEALVERGMENRPIVEALQRQKVSARAGAEAAGWEGYPDLSVFGAWRFRVEQDNGMDDGTDFVSLGVQSSLPFWSGERARAAEDVATARVVSIEAAIAAFRLELRGEIAGHLAELHHLHKHVAYYRDELIPQARQARRSALAGYQAGRADYEDWLEAEQRLVELEAKLATLQARIRKHRALVLALIAEVPIPGVQKDDDTEASPEPAAQSPEQQQPEDNETSGDEAKSGGEE